LKRELDELRGLNSSKGSEMEALLRRIQEKEGEVNQANKEIELRNNKINDFQVFEIQRNK